MAINSHAYFDSQAMIHKNSHPVNNSKKASFNGMNQRKKLIFFQFQYLPAEEIEESE